MTLVIDASVAVKWILPDPARESHVDEALALLEAVSAGTVRALQPAHWLAEVAAVVSRLDAAIAPRAIRLLHAMELPILDDADIYEDACRLATRLGHHVFDTLYHAVARNRVDSLLVTADDRYYRKARQLGAISHVADQPWARALEPRRK